MIDRPSDMRYMHGTIGSHNSSLLGENNKNDTRNNREVDTIEFEKSKLILFYF